MTKQTKSLFFRLLFSAIIILLILIMQPYSVWTFRPDIDILFPAGIIGIEQRDLLVIIQLVMLIFIIPIYILTFAFSWRYRAGNKKATYDPHLVDHKIAEFIWWGVPLVLTIAVSVLVWIKTYDLDPYRPIKSENKTKVIEVVALQWRWLFIYPEEKIATVNYLRIPKETPIHFKITADAPMNSFWIPKLGGQIYAMPAMETQLYLMSDIVGKFQGYSANISGEGFANMTFEVDATDDDAYSDWVQQMQQAAEPLNLPVYSELAKPSLDTGTKSFVLAEENLFKKVLMKPMNPQNNE